MTRSRKAKGDYYVGKTREWLELEGYLAERLERNVATFTKSGSIFYRKHDIWGADLMARNAERLVFIQVKSNDSHISHGIKQLNQGAWPPGVERWVVYWPYRRKTEEGPDIVRVHEMEVEDV